MSFSSPDRSMKVMRDLFTRGDKGKVPAELKEALLLLRLSDLEGLEERFLATEAFLKPWAVFRDSIFLLKPDAVSGATAITTSDGDRGISRTDILWFYTEFDEDTYRHDPSTNTNGISSAIIKRGWHVEEYEKHLFAWLLQTFKVGKTHNPWGFDFFQLRNICTAWQAVFVPVVNAVRASYSVKGRRHYGRFALFVEERCPSGLAFPKENVNTPQGNLISSTLYHTLLIPKDTKETGVLTRKHYDETEKELRTVYPQYGGLVERPRFKQKMEEWLEEQRARANLKKAAERTREAKACHLEVVKRDGSRTPVQKILSGKHNKDQEKDASASPIKRYSDSIRRSLSRTMSKRVPKEELKSPLHGVTRQLHIPDDPPSPHLPDERSISTTGKHASYAPAQSFDTSIVTPWPRPDMRRESSEQSVYNSVRLSSPFSLPDETHSLRGHAENNGSTSLSKGQLGVFPQYLHPAMQRERQDVYTPSVSSQRSHEGPRIPSYKGSEGEEGILMTNLETVRKNIDRTPEPMRPAKPPTRLPGPIKPTPYTGHLRVASESNNHNTLRKAFYRSDEGLPKPVAWPGTSPTNTSALSGLNDLENSVPPVPTKSSKRGSNERGYVGVPQPQQLLRCEPDRNLARIVSKENIRAALGVHSRDNSEENISLPSSKSMLHDQDAVTSSGVAVLQTYNTHMFPRREKRKGTPVGAWVGAPKSRNITGESY